MMTTPKTPTPEQVARVEKAVDELCAAMNDLDLPEQAKWGMNALSAQVKSAVSLFASMNQTPSEPVVIE